MGQEDTLPAVYLITCSVQIERIFGALRIIVHLSSSLLSLNFLLLFVTQASPIVAERGLPMSRLGKNRTSSNLFSQLHQFEKLQMYLYFHSFCTIFVCENKLYHIECVSRFKQGVYKIAS